MDSNPFQRDSQETPIFLSRNSIAFTLMIGLILVLLWRMFHLQVVEFDQHNAKSVTNRIKVQPLPPTRGLIFDQNGTLLAENKPIFMVTITKERVKDLDKTFAQLNQLLALSTDDLNSYHSRMKRRRRPYESVPLKLKLTEEEIARIAVNLHALPGVNIEADLIRHYPLGYLTAHTVGYVGRINIEEAQRIDSATYAGTRYIGKVGIEHSYEEALLGKVGHEKVETNARGKILRVVEQSPPTPGANLTLYLDMPTQRQAQQALQGKRGAVVAIDPRTGGVLAMVSSPSFDPNLFVTGIAHKTYKELNESRQRPLFNRTVKGQYPPGSTIKPMVGLAGIHYDLTNWNYEIYDIGHFQLKGSTHLYRDWKRTGHGDVNLERAIVESCDTYFYELAHKLTIDRLHEFLSPFGLGMRANIDIPGERSGLLPSRQWKRAHRNLPWYPGETLIAGIGQGFMLATPLQLAVITANTANRGRRIEPKLVKSVGEKPLPSRSPGTIEISDPDEWENIVHTMVEVVHGKKGTARTAGKDLEYTMAGKTGTAQVLGIPQDEVYDAEKLEEWHRDHALFIAFAPAENPMIAISVIVENAGGGGANAAPVARQVMDTYLLPRLPQQYRRLQPAKSQ